MRRKPLSGLVVFGVLVMQTGCSGEDARQQGGNEIGADAPYAGVVPIPPGRVRLFVAGATIPPSRNTSDFPTEVFFDDGHYQLRGRGVEEGEYQISENRVCVKMFSAEQPQCRYAYLVQGNPVLSTASEAAGVTPENSEHLK